MSTRPDRTPGADGVTGEAAGAVLAMLADGGGVVRRRVLDIANAPAARREPPATCPAWCQTPHPVGAPHFAHVQQVGTPAGGYVYIALRHPGAGPLVDDHDEPTGRVHLRDYRPPYDDARHSVVLPPAQAVALAAILERSRTRAAQIAGLAAGLREAAALLYAGEGP